MTTSALGAYRGLDGPTVPSLDRVGDVVRVRSLQPSDYPVLEELVRRTSERSLYQRFLSASPAAARYYLDVVREPARTLDAVVIQLHGEVVAIGSTHPTTRDGVAEAALLIDDRFQGLGLGTLLLEELADRAHRRGLRSLVALALTGNAQIARVLRDLGRDVVYDVDGTTVTATIDVRNDRPPAATARRRRVASAASLDAFLRPRSVVVVGSSARPVHAYREILAKLDRHGREVTVTAVRLHRYATRSARLSPQDAADGADLAVLVVRPEELHDGVLACVRSGVRAVAALGAPRGTGWTTLGRDLATICAAAGVRLLGPVSAGLLTTDPARSFDASTLPLTARPGDVCLVASSRRQAAAVAGLLDVVGIGLSAVVGVGAGADVVASDVVAFAQEDPRSRVVVVCLDGPASVDLGTVDAEGETAVVLYDPPDVGRRPLPAPPHVAIVTRSWMELADTVLLLLSQPRPRGRRVAVVTSSSATAATADAVLESAGLFTATVTQHTEMRTRLIVPEAMHTGGRVLLPASTDPTDVGLVLGTLADDPGVDAVVCALDVPYEGRAGVARALDAVSRDHPGITIVSAGPPPGSPVTACRGRVPALSSLQRVAGALANARRD